MASLAELTVSIVGDVSNVRKAFDELGKGVDNVGTSLTKLGNDMKSMGTSMSMYVTAPLALMGAGAFKVAADFDDSMRKVQAVTGETGDTLTVLRDAALQMGADTAFSSSQVADAMLQLGQAGFTADEILTSTNQVLSLASAGALDLGTAAGITANAMNGFGLEAEDTQRIVDILAKGASISTTSVEGLGNALSYVAPVANAMGMSIEETTSLIAGLSNAGIEGERAGTALRGAISALARPTDQMAVIFGKYNIALDKVNPATSSFTEILGVLEAAGMSASDVMAIFGQEAGPGVLALLGQGTGAIKEQTLALQNSEGAAQQMAETMEGGVGGAMRQFQGSVETLAITLGDLMANALTPVINHLTTLFNRMSSIPEPVLMLVVAMAGLAAAIGPVLIVAGTLISSIGTITTAIAGAGGLSAVLTAVVGILTGPVAIAIAAFAAAAYIVYRNWDTIGPVLDRVWQKASVVFNAILDFVDPVIVKIQEFVGGALTSMSTWWDTNGDAIMRAAGTVGDFLVGVFETIGAVVLFFVSGPLIALYEGFRVAIDIIIPLLEFLGAQFGDMIMLVVNLINGDWSAAWANFESMCDRSIQFVISLFTEVLPTALSDVWNDILTLASYALDLLIQLITGKTGDAATELKTGIVNAGTEMLDGMLGWVPGVSGVVDGMRDQLLRVPDEADSAMSQFGPVVSGQIDIAAIQAAASSGTLVDTTVDEIETLPGAAEIAMNPFSPAITGPIDTAAVQAAVSAGTLTTDTLAQLEKLPTGTTTTMSGYSSLIVNPINDAVSPASSAASSVGTGATNALSTALNPMAPNTTSVMNSVASSIRNSGSSLAAAATSAGSAAVSALNTQLSKVQASANEIKAAVAEYNIFTGQARSSSSGSSSRSSSSSSSDGTGITRQGKEGTGERNVKIREAHATGGIAGYTGWHWMEKGELAIPQQTNWDKLLVQPIVKALSGGSSGPVSAGNVIIQNMPVTLTSGYNFEQLMSDIEKYNSQKRFQRGISL